MARSFIVVAFLCSTAACTGRVDPLLAGLSASGPDSGDASPTEPVAPVPPGNPPPGQALPDAGSTHPDAGHGNPAGPDAGSPGGLPDGGRDFSTDSSKFFGASRCSAAHLLLCDDFESAQLDAKTWTVMGTPPVLDSSLSARGGKSLHISHAHAGPSYIIESKTFPAPNNTYFGRVFVYFKTLPSSPSVDYAHWTIIAADGTGTVGEVRVGGQFFSGANWWGVGTDSQNSASGTGDWTLDDDDPNHQPRPVPVNQWLCVEWMHKGDTNETRFYLNDVEHPSLATAATQHGGDQSKKFILPNFTELWIGWDLYTDDSQNFDLWIDEVAIDTQRIGCVL